MEFCLFHIYCIPALPSTHYMLHYTACSKRCFFSTCDRITHILKKYHLMGFNHYKDLLHPSPRLQLEDGQAKLLGGRWHMCIGHLWKMRTTKWSSLGGDPHGGASLFSGLNDSSRPEQPWVLVLHCPLNTAALRTNL